MTQTKPKGIWEPNQWPAENSVEDSNVATMALKGYVTEFNIIEHDVGLFYVTLRFNWRPDLVHLSTRRNKTEPRLFKDLTRLIAHIKEKYPQIRTINLLLNRRVQKQAKENPGRRADDAKPALKTPRTQQTTSKKTTRKR